MVAAASGVLTLVGGVFVAPFVGVGVCGGAVQYYYYTPYHL